MKKTCPYCGAPLRDEASFCPHCAKSINSRVPFPPPHSILNKKFLFFLFLLCLAAVLSLGFHHYTAPQFFSGAAEVLYEDTDETYQLILNNSLDRYQPIKEVDHTAGDQESYRFPVRMYANHLVTGEDASEEFLSKVESVNVQA